MLNRPLSSGRGQKQKNFIMKKIKYIIETELPEGTDTATAFNEFIDWLQDKMNRNFPKGIGESTIYYYE